jgi:hypothetical protein
MEIQTLLLSAVLTGLAAASAHGQPGLPVRVADTGPGLITCWYNEKKDYTGADTAQPGVKPGIVKGSDSGDYTYGYTKTGGPESCPKKLPASPAPTRKSS